MWCLMDGKIVRPNTINVGVEGDFYKLRQLTNDDRRLLRTLISQSPAPARETLRGFLAIFDGWYELRDHLPPGRSPEVRKALDDYITTAEEKFHAAVESEFAPHLAKLRLGDATPLSDDDAAMQFCHFIALQWVRTARVRKAVLGGDSRYDYSRMWGVASHITAANFGWTLFSLRDRNPLQLIANETGVPFITGDQPVINLQAMPGGSEQPEFLSLYYPISPQYAVFSDDFRHPVALSGSLTDPQGVHDLNRRMVLSVERQAYASTRECLVPYLPKRTHS